MGIFKFMSSSSSSVSSFSCVSPSGNPSYRFVVDPKINNADNPIDTGIDLLAGDTFATIVYGQIDIGLQDYPGPNGPGGILDQENSAVINPATEEPWAEVADGDLTVQATVSEDITGAIADSVNYTVEEKRRTSELELSPIGYTPKYHSKRPGSKADKHGAVAG